jgi:hypothetical protein
MSNSRLPTQRRIVVEESLDFALDAVGVHSRGVRSWPRSRPGSGTVGYLAGPGTAAQFNQPTGVVVAASGNLYDLDMESRLAS